MRTIKFRGKNLYGEWVYGFYVEEERQTINGFEKKHFIVNDGYDYVKPETVGQFTGLHDKDGKEIYEGDILQLKYSDDSYHSSSVYYTQKGYWAVDVSINERIILGYIDRTKLVVIGNIHDNPELLKKEVTMSNKPILERQDVLLRQEPAPEFKFKEGELVEVKKYPGRGYEIMNRKYIVNDKVAYFCKHLGWMFESELQRYDPNEPKEPTQ